MADGSTDFSVQQPGEALLKLLEERRSVSSTWLTEPGPSEEQLQRLLSIGVRVPDHGILEPWRIILVSGDDRHVLSERLGEAYFEANTEMEAERRAKFSGAMSRAFTYAPLVVIVVRRPDPNAHIPVWEQDLSAGAVCMNLLTAAHGLGFGAIWVTGWSASHPAAHGILGLREGEGVAGILHIGTPKEKPAERRRPDLSKVVTNWSPEA